MAKRGGKEEKAEDVGCMCWDCARLGGCPRASCRIKRCSLFVNSVIRVKDMAAAFGIAERTLYRYNQKRGVQWLIDAAKIKGWALIQIREKGARWCVKLPYEGDKK